MSSVITISQPPSIPGDRPIPEVPTEMTFAPMDPDVDPEDIDVEELIDISKGYDTSGAISEGDLSDSEPPATEHEKAQARDRSLAILQSGAPISKVEDQLKSKVHEKPVSKKHASIKRRYRNGPDAVIVLKEERVCSMNLVLWSIPTIPAGYHVPRFPKIRLSPVHLLS